MHLHDVGTAPRRRTSVLDATRLEQDAHAPLLARATSPDDDADLPALEMGSQESDPFRNLLLWWEGRARGTGPGPTVLAPVISATSGSTGTAAGPGGATEAWWAANLAIALAGSGRSTMLIDGRLDDQLSVRRDEYEAPATPGLHEVLLGTDWREAVSAGPTLGLSVMPPGWADKAPSVDLLVERFPAVVAQITEHFDAVVVVGPGLDRGDDAQVMARDGDLLLVVSMGRGVRAELRSGVARVRVTDDRVAGVLVAERRRGRGRP